MQIIKELKIDNKILQVDIDEKDEFGNYSFADLRDINILKEKAIDTITWKIGDRVKKSTGKLAVNLSAANAKAVALLAKFITPTQEQLDSLTELEKDSWEKIKNLADNGYADSQLLNNSLTAVTENIQKGTDKIARISRAKSIDEIIQILNEE